MKNLYLFIVIFLLSTFTSQAQSWEAKSENAQFQNRVNNYAVYTREVKKVSGLFAQNDFELVQNRCLKKEGVFKLEMSDDQSTITVYFLEWIDQWTIDWLFTEANPEFAHSLRIHPKVVHTF